MPAGDGAATGKETAALNAVLVDSFIASRKKAPREIVLDFDATHVPLHGTQEKAYFQRYYDNYCYMPIYVFAGQDLLACVLRPASRDPAAVLSAMVKLLAARLRAKWPAVRLIVRADSGFCPAGACTTSLACRKTKRCCTTRMWRLWRWPTGNSSKAASSA